MLLVCAVGCDQKAKLYVAWRPGPLEHGGVTTQAALNLWGCKLYWHEAGRCCICGSGLPKRRRSWCSQACLDLYWENHNWATASWTAKVRAGHQCTRCRGGGKLEANHIIPVNGGSRQGCVSHQDNLEALCHSCHTQATTSQRQAGLIGAAS